MKVLVVHNRYVSAVPSGENAVVDDEVAALRAEGVEVVTHLRSSDEIGDLSTAGKAALATRPLYSRDDARAVARKLDGVDVLHLHNPYPLVSPWVVRVAKQAGVPVVQTVHNYRHGCVAGSHYRDHHACEDCLRHLPSRWPGVVHGCYRGSRAQSLVLTTAEVLHAGTWRSVDRFLALTAFAQDKLVEAGLPADRITVRPNSAPDPGEPTPPGEGLLFVGRLDEEKGARLLYDAWSRSPVPLTVIGAGTYPPPPGIRYLGPQPPEVVAAEMERCAAVVVPSVVYEGFPRVVAEAFARGRPVLATEVGPLPGLVPPNRGWLAAPTPPALASALASVTPDPVRGAAARAHYVATLTPERTMRALLDVYAAVVR
jgi:glycosyltransferase involved in cell wall biosynthesis